jgi:hypothetical protein
MKQKNKLIKSILHYCPVFFGKKGESLYDLRPYKDIHYFRNYIELRIGKTRIIWADNSTDTTSNHTKILMTSHGSGVVTTRYYKERKPKTMGSNR